MSDLLFDSDLEEEDSGPPINVLALGAPAESSEALTRRAAVCLDPAYRAASMVLFEEDGEFTNFAEFQRAMGWARPPTIDEAGAWVLARQAAVYARTAARAVNDKIER
jgi:hypothetical protein